MPTLYAILQRIDASVDNAILRFESCGETLKDFQPTKLPVFNAIPQGGFIRVGFEDNIYYRKGELAESNAQLVERAARSARDYGSEIASPADVRNLLQLKG